ncbi:lipoate--protein ligase [Terrisporobacter mayombei]|uniref:lipoate--protein ligase n=1 Tax=Terrisporobacter mayombei TaxID=1541 RepID=UPI00265ABB2D|nr:lipoate--protein ligase [Terrisporobacter mayombei]MCC3667922.1 lipoate--protein ligase [Terrisporobacter mayombei]
MIYINSNSTSPYFNFALEEYLLTQKDLDDDEIFLFWRTNPTIMVGRYQNTFSEINEKYVRENNVNVVRRNSGGGTIYTDMGAWQFTFIEKNYKEEGISFDKFTGPIVEALQKQDVDAHFNSRNDLLIGNRKFSGNAQYRKDNAILHHGSILFNTDIQAMVESITVAEDKIIAKGIKSVRERVINISEVMKDNITSENFRDIMLDSLLKNSTTYTLTKEDIKSINKIQKEKFESWDWNYGKNPIFNISRYKRFNGGRVDFKLNVKKGIIKNCTIEGDFFLSGEISILEESFIDCKYVRENISKLLDTLDIENYFYKITKDDLLECIID